MHCTDYHIVNGLISALVNPRGYRYHMHNHIQEVNFHTQKEEKKEKKKKKEVEPQARFKNSM